VCAQNKLSIKNWICTKTFGNERDSIVSSVNRPWAGQPRVHGSISSKGKRFFSSPNYSDWPQSTHCFVSNAYPELFQWDQSSQHGKLTITSILWHVPSREFNTYLRTYSMQQSPSWEANWFSAFYGTRRFITTFTSVCHLSPFSARSIQSMPPLPEDAF
jgi:hypothetical protein